MDPGEQPPLPPRASEPPPPVPAAGPPPLPEPPPIPEPAGGVPWRAIEAIPVWVIAFAGGILTVILGSVAGGGDALVAYGVLATEVVLGVAVIVWVRIRHNAGPRALGLGRPAADDIGIGLGAGVAGVMGSMTIVLVIFAIGEAVSGRRPSLPVQIELERPSAAVVAILFLAVVVAAPIAEEMFFRGFLYRGLRRWASEPKAAVISAAVFAVSHVEPLIMPSIFALGLLQAWLVERRGKLAPAIVSHATFNLIGFLFRFLLN